jgi:hypothetical protein
VVEELPHELDRAKAPAFARGAPWTRAGSLAVFIASQIWGYGAIGYGPFRLGQALADPQLAEALVEARVQLKGRDPVGAFRTLCVEHEFPYVGASFGSKFLYLADPHRRALILDSVVRKWLAEHAGLNLAGGRDEREYAVWLLVAEHWARALRVRGDQLELVIFNDGDVVAPVGPS